LPVKRVLAGPAGRTAEGKVTVESTEKFLRDYMIELHGFITRVYTVLPRPESGFPL
jgi:chromate reductase